MFFWQAQVFWRTLQLKKQFPKRNNADIEPEISKVSIDAKTKELLNEADFSDVVPASVTEKTTKNLKQKIGKSS